MSLPVIIVGSGGHSRVLIDALLLQSIKIIGFTDSDTRITAKIIQGIHYLGDDLVIEKYLASDIQLVNGVGSIGSALQRKQIYDRFKEKGYSFASVIHPSAIISRETELDEGVQIMAGAIIQAGCRIGKNTIINTKASVDHDCVIDKHVHIAPGATLSGGVNIEECVHIGTGAIIIQRRNVFRHSIVGAGAVVVKDVPANCTVYGVPAKEVKA